MQFRLLIATVAAFGAAAVSGDGDHGAHNHGHSPASLSVPVSSSYSASSSPSITSGYSSTVGGSSASISYGSPSPSATYNAPAPASPSYGASSPSASQPSVSYSAPAPAPSSSYNAPSSGSSSSTSSSKSSSSYEAPAASTGNLYYYYYPVAAYPIHNRDGKPHPSHGHIPPSHYGSSGSSNSFSVKDSSSDETDFGPLIFLLVPLVLLLLAVPFLSLIGTNVNNNGRSFTGRSSDLDNKFGTFEEFQAEIDLLLAKYVSALNSEQCMDRIVCELGVKASGLPSKSLLFR